MVRVQLSERPAPPPIDRSDPHRPWRSRISRGGMKLPQKATVIEHDPDVDGHYKFTKDLALDLWVEGVDLVLAYERWSGESEELCKVIEESLEQPRFLTLAAKAKQRDVKGLALRLCYLPFSVGQAMSSTFRPPKHADDRAKADGLLRAAKELQTGPSYLAEQTSEILRPYRKDEKGTAYARLMIPESRFATWFSGYSREEKNEALVSLGPVDLQRAVKTVANESVALHRLLERASNGGMYLGPGVLKKNVPSGPIGDAMTMAVERAFAGPDAIDEDGPGLRGWKSEPVAALAARRFRQFLYNMMRRGRGATPKPGELPENIEASTQAVGGDALDGAPTETMGRQEMQEYLVADSATHEKAREVAKLLMEHSPSARKRIRKELELAVEGGDADGLGQRAQTLLDELGR